MDKNKETPIPTLRELREQANLTQEQLAAKLGKARTTVIAWENGQKLPRLDHAIELANALDVDVLVVAKSLGLT